MGHELVHVGQTRTYPELGARLRAAVEESCEEIFVGVAQDPEREKEANILLTNVEGYAHYVESLYLRQVYTHAEPIERVTRAADERFRFLERRRFSANTSGNDAGKSEGELLVERLLASKRNQYEAGRQAYVARGQGERPVPFDPTLRPELHMLLGVLGHVVEALGAQTKKESAT